MSNTDELVVYGGEGTYQIDDPEQYNDPRYVFVDAGVVYGGNGTYQIDDPEHYYDPRYVFVDDGAVSVVRKDGEVITMTESAFRNYYPDVATELEAGSLSPVKLILKQHSPARDNSSEIKEENVKPGKWITTEAQAVYLQMAAFAERTVEKWRADYIVHDRSWITKWDGAPFFYLVGETGTTVVLLQQIPVESFVETEKWIAEAAVGRENIYYYNGVRFFGEITSEEAAHFVLAEKNCAW